jgi:hypothetical protein
MLPSLNPGLSTRYGILLATVVAAACGSPVAWGQFGGGTESLAPFVIEQSGVTRGVAIVAG